MGDEQVNEFVHRFAGFDHQHDPAGFLQQGHQFLDGMSAEHSGAFGFFGEKIVHFGDGAVEGDHDVAVIVHVKYEILAHDSQTDECDVRFRFHVQFRLRMKGLRYKRPPVVPEEISEESLCNQVLNCNRGSVSRRVFRFGQRTSFIS